jgi:hypothetical protein
LRIDDGDEVGLRIDVDGSEDFKGTVTADIAQVGSADGQIRLPLPARAISWHGIPDAKKLIVLPNDFQPTGQAGAYECEIGQDSFPCDPALIRQTLDRLWGESR